MTTYGLQPLVTIYHPPYKEDSEREVWRTEIFEVGDMFLLIHWFPRGNRGFHDFTYFETAFKCANRKDC